MKKISLQEWKHMINGGELHSTHDFFSAIKRQETISIIAEVKKASPSKGIIKEDFDPVMISKEYAKAGVQAVSVLTEKEFFLGNDEFLVKIRQSLELPILRKDFIIDLWQIYQSRFLGADAILLIVSILTDEELRKFKLLANSLGMQCLVEVHDRDELERALKIGAEIIGINNRNLKTFEVDLRTTEKLMNYLPNDRAVVSESGIKTNEDMNYLRELGVDAVLIGETFMRAESIVEKINDIRKKVRS